VTATTQTLKTADPGAVARGVEAAWRAMWAPGEPTSPAPTELENPLLWCQVRAIAAAAQFDHTDQLHIIRLLLAHMARRSIHFEGLRYYETDVRRMEEIRQAVFG
jgi:hypothetical protein